ncbi:unnamed protein product [Ixodes hexagonus]
MLICAYNMNGGSGGASVLEVVAAFQEASGVHIPYDVVGRRAGDVDKMVATSELARTGLGWEAGRSLLEMCTCKDVWRWKKKNPTGYSKGPSEEPRTQ